MVSHLTAFEYFPCFILDSLYPARSSVYSPYMGLLLIFADALRADLWHPLSFNRCFFTVQSYPVIQSYTLYAVCGGSRYTRFLTDLAIRGFPR